MSTLTQMNAILKDDYKEYWEQLNQTCFIPAQVATKRDTIEGRRATHAIHTSRSGAVGARAADTPTLPTAVRQGHTTVQVPLRWVFGRIELDLPLIEQASGGSASFVDSMENEMAGIRNDASREICRQVWGTSNGVIATCGTTSSSTTVQLLATVTTAAQMRHLYVNKVVDIGTVASPSTVASARSITAFDVTNKTITISGAAISTTSGTHYVFTASAGGASDNTGNVNDGQKELTGLQTIVAASGTLHTVDPSTYGIWKAQSYSNSGTQRNLAENMVTQAILQNTVESGSTVNLLVSNIGVGMVAQQMMAAYNRNLDTLEVNGGFKGIRWATPGVGGSGSKDLGWFIDFDCPHNALYGINTEALVMYEDQGWRWMDHDGSVLSRVANTAAYEASLYTSQELACVRRNANFVISDLVESSI